MIATWIALLAPAFAEESPISHCQTSHPMVGTTAWRTTGQARATNAQTFGTAQFTERVVFPELVKRMEPGRVGFTLATEFNWLYNTLDVPSVEDGCVPELRYSMRGVDLGALSFGAGVSYGRVGAFYAAGATSSAPTTPEGRIMLVPATAAFAMIAPIYRLDISGGLWAVSSDWTGGLVVDAEYVTVRGGYIGSSGFYANLSQETVRVFASAILTQQVQSFPYLKAGVDRLMIPKVGMLSGFFRKLPLEPNPAYDPVTGEAIEEADPVEPKPSSLQTSHFQWQDIGGKFDIYGAYATRPSRMLYELRVAVHSKGANPEPPFGSPFGSGKKDKKSDKGEEEATAPSVKPSWLLSGGFVTLPDMYYYGIEGGMKPTGILQYGGFAEGAAFYLSLRFNDPELLAIFPYAYDTLGLYIQFGGSGSQAVGGG